MGSLKVRYTQIDMMHEVGWIQEISYEIASEVRGRVEGLPLKAIAVCGNRRALTYSGYPEQNSCGHVVGY